MRKPLALLISLFMLLSAAPMEEPTCVFYKGSARLVNGDIGLQFKNSCWMPMWIRVCTLDKWGKPKVTESIRNVPPNGYFTMVLDIYKEPEVIHFSYAARSGDLADPCPK